MPLIITELAIKPDGTFAVELMNTDASTISISSVIIVSENNGATISTSISNLGTPATLSAGQIITIGHTSFTVDFSSVVGNGVFANTPVDVVSLAVNNAFNVIDHIGQSNGSDLGTDIVYRGTDSRTPDASKTNNNLSDFTSSTPFSTSDLGSVDCFAQGTLIATPSGETPVEALAINDFVCTADGRAVPLRWIGRQTLTKLFHRDRARLVRIAAGALSNHSDLYVTGDHGMVLDGYVINASALENGGSIDWVSLADTPERQTVYHVETEAHDVILANGAPSETYLDMPGRAAFDNFQEYLDLYGTERKVAENKLPRISSRRLVPEALKTNRVA